MACGIPFLLTKLLMINLISQRTALALLNCGLFSERYSIEWQIVLVWLWAPVLKLVAEAAIGNWSVVKVASICESYAELILIFCGY